MMYFFNPRYLELLVALIVKDFRVRYKNTALGFLWSMAIPLLFALVFYLVFETVLRQRGELAQVPYLAFLLAGLFPWHWFASALTASPSIYVGNPGLIKKV